MNKVVVINRHIVRSNKKEEANAPPIRVSNGKYGKPEYFFEYAFNGTGKVIYSPDKPLPCGATCYIELSENK